MIQIEVPLRAAQRRYRSLPPSFLLSFPVSTFHSSPSLSSRSMCPSVICHHSLTSFLLTSPCVLWLELNPRGAQISWILHKKEVTVSVSGLGVGIMSVSVRGECSCEYEGYMLHVGVTNWRWVSASQCEMWAVVTRLYLRLWFLIVIVIVTVLLLVRVLCSPSLP